MANDGITNIKFYNAPKDITNYVAQKNQAAPDDAIKKYLANVLTKFFASTGCDPNWVEVIVPDEMKI